MMNFEAIISKDQPMPTLKDVQQAYIEFVMSKTKGKKTAAARILGMNRRTLYRRPTKAAADSTEQQST